MGRILSARKELYSQGKAALYCCTVDTKDGYLALRACRRDLRPTQSPIYPKHVGRRETTFFRCNTRQYLLFRE